MVANTPLYSLPYPTTGDTYSEALMGIPEDLAVAVESTIAGFGGIAAPGSWVTVGAGGGAPAFATGWGNYGAPFNTVQYRKVGVRVYLRGLAISASNRAADDPVFTLPAGFRPLGQLMFTAIQSNGQYRVDVKTAGDVTIPAAAASGVFVSLSGISFAVD
jgi:hypothetical protein